MAFVFELLNNGYTKEAATLKLHSFVDQCAQQLPPPGTLLDEVACWFVTGATLI